MTTTPTTPTTRERVQGWIDEQARYAREDVTAERARITEAAAAPDFDLSAIANMASRAAGATGQVDAYEAAAKLLRENGPAALAVFASLALRPTGGIYGARTASQQEAYVEGYQVASRTALSALQALAAVASTPDPAALAVARHWAGYNLGDPGVAQQVADILTDPSAAEGELRRELGDDYDTDHATANRP